MSKDKELEFSSTALNPLVGVESKWEDAEDEDVTEPGNEE
jgi:hypothetical protein